MKNKERQPDPDLSRDIRQDQESMRMERQDWAPDYIRTHERSEAARVAFLRR